ncbi:MULTISPECIES: hypothetical protein [Arthrobacter]|uniref:Carboxymuconolactone decarboxylase family protein n=1 Tax=Arthrobacter terricola TaxID=2547396 RepID=A0A4R5K5K1_9MICC|nr:MULTISPECIES: hypothetical protein [Arthrobacter]MBT8163775.1 hypothetical protein [Arthrobacter sp. GN70]TDF87028.1 hypothetical protein E1809_25280 [Arthrobacter terricola]
MSTDAPGSHVQLAAALRSRVADTGTLEPGLRRAILARAGGGNAAPEPYDALAKQVGEDSFRVTDAQVDAVLEETGSEKDTFEVILTAAIGAGLRRWDAAGKAIREAEDAAT